MPRAHGGASLPNQGASPNAGDALFLCSALALADAGRAFVCGIGVCFAIAFPDALFGIEYATEGQKRYRFFALEADRNSEPIMRATLQQSSVARKIVQYREVIAQTIHKAYWGLPNLFVLTVTTNERHTKNMMQRVAELTEGKGSPFLLFKTMPSLASLEHAPLPTPHMLREPWQRVEHEAFRIDRT